MSALVRLGPCRAQIVLGKRHGREPVSTPKVIAGTYDTQLKNTFARIEALDWGGAVTPISTTTGSKEIIPGSQYGGTKPTEMIWLGNHEPNINTGRATAPRTSSPG
jgi:hypothetical protein